MEVTVFLDRDNTLIANDGDLGDPEAVHLLEGVAGGLKALRRAGYGLVVVSNQGGVARGVFTEEDVDSVHQRIAALVDDEAHSKDVISRFYYCPYHPEAKLEDYRRDHPWRKPQPGMLRQAARDLDLDLSRCWMIGDQARDVEAGRAAGCRTVLLTSDGAVAKHSRPTIAVRTFPEAVQAILRDSSRRASTIHVPAGPAPAGPAPAGPAPPGPAPPGPAPPGPAPPGPAPAGPAPAGPAPPGPAPPGPAAAAPAAPAAADGKDQADRPARGAADSGKKKTGRGDLDRLQRSIEELTEVIRSDQQRRVEFTGFRLAAGMCQLLALLLALLGLLQLGSRDVYLMWMIGAVLAQLLTIAILIVDVKG